MFRFAHPDFLYLLFLLPALVAFYVYAMIVKKKAIKKYGNPTLLAELMPEVSTKRQHLKFWLLFGAITMVIFIIAGPQFGSKLETVKRQGVEIMVCLDVSNSMLAEDVSPNRLDKAKQMLSRLTDGFTNDKVGLIVFAGDAFTQLPITSDYISAKMFLSSINPSMVSTQGTAIGAAINLAARSFTPDETPDKAIILITDGENHEDDAIGAAKAAADYQTAALGNVCLNDLIGKVVVTDDDHGSPLHHAVGDRVVVTAHNTADTVISGNGGIALQCDVIHRTHVVAHNAANGHGSAFRYCDRGIFQSQVFHLTAAHAEQTGTAVIGIRSIAQVGNSVAVSVKGAEEQGGVCLHVVHIADGSPLDTGQVQITGQFEANTGVAALRAIVDIGSKGQQGIHAVDLVGVFLRAGTAVIVGGNSSGADGRSSRRTCGSAACGTLGGRTCTA